jgi:FkbM family methyltransferase
MCAKLSQVLAGLVPGGPLKEAFTSSYYRLYYNRKHFRENGFRVYFEKGHFEYDFDGIKFASYENMSDELKRSLNGYIARYAPKKGDVVIDCGAYIGEFALYAAKAVLPGGTVVAFEPDPGIYRKLEANIKLNGLTNVIAVNKGVWSSEGSMKFIGNDKEGYSFMLSPNPSAVDLPVTSMDRALADLGVRRVDFIKIDAEGAEIEVVRGAESTLKNNDAKLAIASYHMLGGNMTFVELEKILPGFGYRTETAHPQHLTTYAWKENQR